LRGACRGAAEASYSHAARPAIGFLGFLERQEALEQFLEGPKALHPEQVFLGEATFRFISGHSILEGGLSVDVDAVLLPEDSWRHVT